MITIVDYGAGNVSSVKSALDFLGVDSKLTDNPEDIEKADNIVFPGQGSFGPTMERLRKKRLEEQLKKAIETGKPYLGICIGLQTLFEESEECPGVRGLGILKGKVVKFKKGKVPQIGWNKIKPTKNNLLKEGYAYFANSYYVRPNEKEVIVALTDYNGDFTSAVQTDNVTAIQFHPEKSGDYGLDFLKRWLNAN